MSDLKFDVLDLIREPDNYTSGERAAGSEAVRDALAAGNRVIRAFRALGRAGYVQHARARQECEASMVALEAARARVAGEPA